MQHQSALLSKSSLLAFDDICSIALQMIFSQVFVCSNVEVMDYKLHTSFSSHSLELTGFSKELKENIWTLQILFLYSCNHYYV